MGLLHHRPEKRHVVDLAGVGSAESITGLGHSASVAAMMTAASSSVGVGDIATPVGGPNGSKDWLTSEILLVCTRPTQSRRRPWCQARRPVGHGV